MPGKVVSQEEWTAARKDFLVKEKAMSRAQAKLIEELHDLPMVKITKNYTFHTSDGDKTLVDLFRGKKQLIVYHFMLAPDQEEGCPGCTFVGEHIPDVRLLGTKDTAFTAVSRSPLAGIEKYKARLGWKFPWASSHGSDFNYDFHVTMDESVAPIEYNYKTKAELEAAGLKYHMQGEQPGLSVFYREGDDVFHSYSSFARGLEKILTTMNLLDMTPLGRQTTPMGPAEFKRNYEYGPDDE